MLYLRQVNHLYVNSVSYIAAVIGGCCLPSVVYVVCFLIYVGLRTFISMAHFVSSYIYLHSRIRFLLPNILELGLQPGLDIRMEGHNACRVIITRSVAARFGRHGMPPPDMTGRALGQDGSY